MWGYDQELKQKKTVNNMIEVNFKYVPFNCKFIHNDIEYEKTNHNRGFYDQDGRRIFKNFKKSTKVFTNNEYFDIIP